MDDKPFSFDPWGKEDQAGADDETARFDAAAEFARDVTAEAYRLRVREAARAQVAADTAGDAPPFDAGTLVEVLARPTEPPYRVGELIPSDAATLVVAQRKTGKTILQLNLARCLLTADDFLGRFGVRPIVGRVAILNYEVSARQLATWAHEVAVPADRLYLVNLRGRRNPLADVDDRAELADRLRAQEVESLIVDPFGRAYHGRSQNDAGEVGAWLADLDRFARTDCGVSDVVLTAHAGWDGERTRGASALEDWADSIITVVRDRDDDRRRYLRAEGRDVLVDEDRLDYDPTTRRLTLAGAGSRKVVARTRHLDELVDAVVDAVVEHPGVNGVKLEAALRDAGVSFQRGDHRKAASLAVDRGILRVESGPRGAKEYHLARPSPTSPNGSCPDLAQPVYIRARSGRLAETTDLAQPVDDCGDCGAALTDPPPTRCGCPDVHEQGVLT